MRLARLVPALLLAFPPAAWPCSPAAFEPWQLKGRTAARLVLDAQPIAVTLRDPKGVVWEHALEVGKAFFAPNDAWVGFAPALGGKTLTVISTQRGAQPITVDVLAQLNEDEKSQLTFTSCGLSWVNQLKPGPDGLRVEVSQDAQARPTEARRAGLWFLVRPDGTVVRETEAMVVDLPAVAAGWKGSASAARDAVLERLVHLSTLPSGKAQAAKLGPLLDRVLDAPDASPRELAAVAALVSALPSGEVEARARAVFRRGGADERLLWGLAQPHPALAQKLAAEVFGDSNRGSNARATALRVATQDGRSGLVPLLVRGLDDADPKVRHTALDGLSRVECSVDALELMLKAARRGEDDGSVGLLHAVRSCVEGSQKTAMLPRALAALQAGLVLPPRDAAAPQLLFDLAVFADVAADKETAARLLGLTRAAMAAQPYPDQMLAVQLEAWTVLRAARVRDVPAAKAALAALKAAAGDKGFGWFCEFDPGLVGMLITLQGCKGAPIATFIDRAELHLGLKEPEVLPPPPAAPPRRRK